MVDRYLLHVDANAASQVYGLWVGMYESGTQSHLDVVDPSGASLGRA